MEDRKALIASKGIISRAARALGTSADALRKRLHAWPQVEWWIATRKHFRAERKKDRHRREYAKKKAKDAQKAASAYLATLENSNENDVT